MTEALQPYDHSHVEIYGAEPVHEPRVYESSFDARARMKIYEYAVDKTDTKKQAWDFIGLIGDETVLDVGCSDLADLIRLRKKYEHRGTLIGVDTNKILFSEGLHTVVEENLLPIDSRIGRAENLIGIDDSSVDVVQAWAMLYHTNVEQVLDEIQRVLKPDGVSLVSTWGPDNIPAHRAILKMIATLLRPEIPGIKPPEPTTTRFNIPVADTLLPSRFEVVKTFPKSGPIHITAEGLEHYILSLQTRISSFNPIPNGRQWRWVIDTYIRPLIQRDIDTKGFFTDSVDSMVYICRNPVTQT